MANTEQLNDLGERTHREVTNMMLGVQIGVGSARRVFINDLNPLQVVKIEHGSGFQNVQEWLIWQEVRNKPDLAKWFAPCDFISPNGSVLVMRRTEQPKIAYPEQVPAFFTDLKLTNWGEFEDRLVCHDYGMLARFYSLSKRQKKADWWRLDH